MLVTARPIDAMTFAPFGQMIDAPRTPGRQSFADGLSHGGRPLVLSTSNVDPSVLPLQVVELERHPYSSQTFLPLEVNRWLVVVAPPTDPAAVQAFTVGPEVGVTIAPGVWHHRLTALGEPGRFAVLMGADGESDDEFTEIEPIDIVEGEPEGKAEEASAALGPPRDLIGYRGQPPDPQWPGGARLAINFVLNVEEGSEPSVLDGDGYTENRLTDATMPLDHNRDLAAEGLFEYGSRVGFWRVQRAFHEREIPLTMFACAVALERNPHIAAAIIDGGHDVCCHGYRWVNHRAMGEEEEREQIRLAVESFRQTLGHQPPGWYCRYGPSVNTRRLLVEHGGFTYDSDAYNDDLPYWTGVEGSNHLVVPYSLTTNDAILLTSTGSTWADFIGDAIDVLRREGQERPAMLSIGLHPRIVGQPARFSGLARLLDRVANLDDVWLTSRLAIANHWTTTHPPAQF